MQPITDHRLASSILDHLGYTLRDLSLEYGDIVITHGDISHDLFWGNSLLGHVWTWGGDYHTSLNYSSRITAELAALDLLPSYEIEAAVKQLEINRALVPDYI